MVRQLRGVLPIVHTPFAASDTIDVESLRREIDWAFACGADGLGTGMVSELLRLTGDERLELTRLIVELDQQYADGQHLLGRFRLSVTGEDWPLIRGEHPPQWRALLGARELSEEERSKLLRYYLSLDVDYRELEHAQRLLANPRLAAVQDLAWALINSPAFLFNH